jgi:hypothetical protein
LLDAKQLEESLNIAIESKTVERANDLKNLISRLKAEITGYVYYCQNKSFDLVIGLITLANKRYENYFDCLFRTAIVGNTDKKSKRKRKRKLSASNETSKNELQNGGTLEANEKIVSKKRKKKSKEKS